MSRSSRSCAARRASASGSACSRGRRSSRRSCASTTCADCGTGSAVSAACTTPRAETLPIDCALMFITFEGPEGSGKSTQIQRVGAWLRDARAASASSRRSRAARRSPTASARSCSTPRPRAWMPMAELLLYAASRRQHVVEVIRPALQRGELVLCDRYTDATLAYQGYGRLLDLDRLQTLNQWATDGAEAGPHAALRPRRGDRPGARARAQRRHGRGRGALRGGGPALPSPRARGISCAWRPRSRSASPSIDADGTIDEVFARTLETLRQRAPQTASHDHHHLTHPRHRAPRRAASRDHPARPVGAAAARPGGAHRQDAQLPERLDRRRLHVVPAHRPPHASRRALRRGGGGQEDDLRRADPRASSSEATMRPYEGRTRSSSSIPRTALSVSGSNSLLKTLEEPARDTTFLLHHPLARSAAADDPVALAGNLRRRHRARAHRPARSRCASAQVALLDEGEELAGDILDLLHRYATRGESAALLALAAIVSDHDDVKDAIALLGADALRRRRARPARIARSEEARRDPRAHPAARSLLAAADAAMAAIRWLERERGRRGLLRCESVCRRSSRSVDVVDVTGYKKTTPPFPAGSGDSYWMGPAGALGGELFGSVRFKEEFNSAELQRQAVTTESGSRLPIQ